MPGYDGTGPNGRGAMTGRGLGQCNTGRRVGTAPRRGAGLGLGYRRGFGRGFGRGVGRCFGNFFYDGPIDEQTEKSLLEKEKSDLEWELKNVNDVLKKYSEDDGE